MKITISGAAISAWLHQASTRTALVSVAGLLAEVSLGQATWTTAVPLIATAVVGAILPDNPAARAAAGQLVTDAVQVAQAIEKKPAA